MLTDKQLSIVTSEHTGHLCVAGVAGSGKSTCAAERLLWLMNTKQGHRRVLALTAHESRLRARLDQQTAFYELERLGHGVFSVSEWCQQTLEEIGQPKSVFGTSKLTAFLMHHVHELPLQRFHQSFTTTLGVKKTLHDLIRFFRVLETEGITPAMYDSYTQNLSSETDDRTSFAQQELAQVYQVYRTLLDKHGITSWHGAILDLLGHVQPVTLTSDAMASSHVREALLHGFSDLIIDDLHAMTPAMIKLVALLAQSPSMTSSTIFANRICDYESSHMDYFVGQLGSAKSLERVDLDENLRAAASPAIFSFAHRVLGDVALSNTDERSPVTCLQYQSMSDEERGIADLIKRKIVAGIAPNDIAVLVPTYGDAQRAAGFFLDQGIPVQNHETHAADQHLFDAPGASAVYSLLMALSSPDSSTHVFNVLRSRFFNFQFDHLTIVMNIAQRTHKPLLAAMGDLAGNPTPHLTGVAAESFAKEAARFLQLFQELQSNVHQRPVQEVIQVFLQRTGSLESLLDPVSPMHEEESVSLADFLREVEAAQRIVGSPLTAFVAPYLTKLRETRVNAPFTAASSMDPHLHLNSPGVMVLPLKRQLIHSVEARCLILMSMRDSKFPGRMKRLTLPLPMELLNIDKPVQNRAEHVRRCEHTAFHALTRAKEDVVLSYFSYAVPSSTRTDNRKPETISRVFAPVWDVDTAAPAAGNESNLNVVQTASGGSPQDPSTGQLMPSKEQRVDIAIDHLSYSQINEFARCPHKYYLSRVLKLEADSNSALMYGRALHEAIAAFARYLQDQPGAIEAAMVPARETLHRTWQSVGFLSAQQEAHLYKQAELTLERFMHAYLPSSVLDTEIPDVLHVEHPFQIQVPEAGTMLHGVWDRIDRYHDGRVIIKEFKSSMRGNDTARNTAKLAQESLQLKLYMHAYTQVFGSPPHGAELVYIGSDDAVGTGFIPFNPQACQEAIEAVVSTADAIRAAQFAPRPSYFECAMCPFAHSMSLTMRTAARAMRAPLTMRRAVATAAAAKPPAHVTTRSFNALREKAVRAMAGKLKENLEHNPNLWLSAAAVDEPTVSILDPAPGYAAHDSRAYQDLSVDFDKPTPDSENVIEFLNTDPAALADPFALVRDDMATVTDSIKRILGSDHPVLAAVAKYFFETDGGKKVRPTMVLLVARAAEAHRAATGAPLPANQSPEFTVLAQRRLAEITEMIHTASLLHDDVIDEADTRRGVASVNKVFGDKLAILAGDFLLARSSICLARLRSLEAIELMSTAIEHLVKGEVMQMRNVEGRADITPFEYYLRKNYYKTGSLMSNSCKAALELGKHDEHVCNMGFAYGRHIGLAFQLIDDVLDYQGHQSGKPLLADLKAGLATAPLLLAQEEFPTLKELALRKFARDGDIELASELVEKSTGIARTKALAIGQAELACRAAMQLAPSPERDALVRLAQLVVFRSK
ncbi:TPA: hypothetical protein N0F65_005105 [Lagenidium giganteum]|uniref:UvrD-like helicase C-terminal domain-containing protein n=1 Tax=Lagenidium giganteum TaxID=4803 RepID=A0AAV2Z3J3_9STRA|nr:TPA: hypothetical protein N0F65_005105 [Lagenidium giganteum]